jgi:hypothetical protein
LRFYIGNQTNIEIKRGIKMQLSEIDRKIIANVHSLPLNEQQAILKYSLLLKENKKKYVKNKTSFSSKLQAFLKEVELEPLDIDTSIFDDYRKSVTTRDFRWED